MMAVQWQHWWQYSVGLESLFAAFTSEYHLTYTSPSDQHLVDLEILFQDHKKIQHKQIVPLVDLNILVGM